MSVGLGVSVSVGVSVGLGVSVPLSPVVGTDGSGVCVASLEVEGASALVRWLSSEDGSFLSSRSICQSDVGVLGPVDLAGERRSRSGSRPSAR